MSATSPAIRVTPDTLRDHDARIEPGASVLAKLRHSANLVRGKVDHTNRKSFAVVLDEPALSADGRVLYPAGASLLIPRMASAALEIPADGYCLLAPANVPTPPAPVAPTPPYTEPPPPAAPIVGFKPRGMVATLRESALTSYLAAKDRLAALQSEASALAGALSAQEAALLSAYESGAMAPAGWRLAMEVQRSGGAVSPKWKDEAFKLAAAQGISAETYEASVRARTPPGPTNTVKHLVVERADAKGV